MSLSGTRFITGEALKLDSNSAQHIQHLDFIDCQLTDNGLLKILIMSGIQLISLHVTGSYITGQGFHVLQDKFTNMEKLSLARCMQLTQRGLWEILIMCGTKLQHLDISWKYFINAQEQDKLQGKFSDLKTRNLGSSWIFNSQGPLKVLRMCETKLSALKTLNLEHCFDCYIVACKCGC